MNELALELKPETARRIFRWQLVFFAVFFTLTALSNSYSVKADWARGGKSLPLAAPLVWEFSSHILLWLLIPVMAWWLERFPIRRGHWQRSLPAHLLATVPFSLLHTVGMVLLRKLAYWSAGFHYDFGAPLSNWFYEYRKDFSAYWLLLSLLVGFRFYGLWLDMREARAAHAAAPPAPEAPKQEVPNDRLVVRKLNREFILNCADIDRLEADGNYVVVHADGQSYRLRESLDGLARRLGERRFARVHRTHVVNIDRIREIQPWDHGDYRIVLKDGNFVNFSRRYRNRLDQLLR